MLITRKAAFKQTIPRRHPRTLAETNPVAAGKPLSDRFAVQSSKTAMTETVSANVPLPTLSGRCAVQKPEI